MSFRRQNNKLLMSLVIAAATVAGVSCTRHTVEVQPIRVEPIHLTVDINVKVDRELDDFFDYKEAPPPPDLAPTVPAAPPAEPALPEATGEVTP